MDAAPGLFRDIREIVVDAGQAVSVAFDPPPLDFDAWRGSRSATIQIDPTGGRKPAGESYRVLYVLANYGGLTVAEGKVPDDGTIPLDGIEPSGPDGVGPSYHLMVGGKSLGAFRVKDEPGEQVVTFRTPIQKGDLALDAEAEELATGRKVRLASYRGRLVFLEFWATWCGPCQEPMEKLVDLAERRGKEWSDRVALVAVGIDKDRGELEREVARQRPTSIRHLWSPDFRSERPDAASTVYSIDSVPSAFLIDPEGRIVWTGHPRSLNLEVEIDKLLER
jgi:thiol-disulfide isomerase/thioredoxin